MIAFGRCGKLRHLLVKSCPIMRKFQDTKSPPELINFVSRGITGPTIRLDIKCFISDRENHHCFLMVKVIDCGFQVSEFEL